MRDVVKIAIIGCGVSGLSCAVLLLERGHDVSIVARELPPHTTSNVAAAFWYPYKAYPEDRVTRWATASYPMFAGLAKVEGTGVTMRAALELFRTPVPDPWWMTAIPGFRRAAPGELPAGYVDGYAFEAPVIDTRSYMPYLVDRVTALGGDIATAEIFTLDEALAREDVVVNCAGLGARELASDDLVHPIRGQIVRVPGDGLDVVLIDEHGPAGISYIVPRGSDCVVGGTAEVGSFELAADETQTREILARARALDPRLSHVEPVGVAVGLRPGRREVRLESEHPAPGKLLVHDYGHGGAGVTLSWGCALDVVDLVEAGAPPVREHA